MERHRKKVERDRKRKIRAFSKAVQADIAEVLQEKNEMISNVHALP